MKRFLHLIFIFLSLHAVAQKPGDLIDEVAAIVGDNVVMQSEVEFEYGQMQKELNMALSDTVKCSILRQKILDNVLLSKAQTDSVVIDESRVDGELEKRVRYYAQQFGGEKNMEEFYGKSITQIKADNREKIRNNMLMQEMQGKALKDVKVSPTDIKKLFNEMTKDSLPFYSAEIEVAQIVISPKVSPEAKQIAYEKIKELRERIINGETFSTLALIYSDDKGSAVNGGALGYFSRGDMVPEFEAAAFRLKPDTVSKIIETKYGYHIMQLIDRRGDNINVRHILIRPKIFKTDVEAAKNKLDSILWLVKIDTMTFETAAKKFSDDDATKANGGFITEGQTGTTKLPVDEMDKELYFKIEPMEPGDFSEPELFTKPGPDREQAWRVFYLKSETKPHRANLRDDYQKFQVMAQQRKQATALNDYIEKARKQVYIHVADNYTDCRLIQPLLTK